MATPAVRSSSTVNRGVLPNSVMPAYPFLFRELRSAPPGSRVVSVPDQYKPEGAVVVPSEDALALVAYLKTLKHDTPLEEGAVPVR